MGYIGNRPTAVPLTSADIQDGVITAADLGANSVDSSELVNGSVDLGHLSASGTASSSTFLRGDNSWVAAGGGKIGQVIDSGAGPDAVIIGSASFVALTDGTTALAASITPSATSSSVLMMVSIMSYCGAGDGYGVSLRRGGVEFYASASDYEIFNNNASSNYSRSFWMALDTGISTTSATEYTVYVKTYDGHDVTFQRTENDSKIILMEVLA